MTDKVNSVCIFCGAKVGKDPAFSLLANSIGNFFGTLGIKIIYGGGTNGLMGIVADAALNVNGQIVGISSEILHDIEKPHKGLSELIITPTLNSRKETMLSMSDAFLILPGGYGTLDEFFEIITLLKIKFIKKKVFIININGFWNDLIKQIEKIKKYEFVVETDKLYVVCNDFEDFKNKFTI